jgi:hypothetical protein
LANGFSKVEHYCEPAGPFDGTETEGEVHGIDVVGLVERRRPSRPQLQNADNAR